MQAFFYATGLAFSHFEKDHNIYKSDPEVYYILFHFILKESTLLSSFVKFLYSNIMQKKKEKEKDIF